MAKGLSETTSGNYPGLRIESLRVPGSYVNSWENEMLEKCKQTQKKKKRKDI